VLNQLFILQTRKNYIVDDVM